MTNTQTAVTNGPLSDDERDLIRGFVDIVVPAGSGFPSASEVSVHTRWIDRGLGARPELRDPMLGIARACAAGDKPAVLEQLEHEDAETLEAVLELVVACYYMSPKVRKRMGYAGQVAAPILPGETDYYLRDDVLKPVIDEGPRWRTTGDERETEQPSGDQR